MHKVFPTSQIEDMYHILETLHSERDLVEREKTALNETHLPQIRQVMHYSELTTEYGNEGK